MNEQEIVVPGDPNLPCTCITAPERPFASHCWIRAAHHAMEIRQFDYFARVEAYNACYRMAEAVSKQAKRPQRIEPVRGFTWGTYKSISPIK